MFNTLGGVGWPLPAEVEGRKPPRVAWMLMRLKRRHEFHDPIQDFISLDRQERLLIDSEPFQRLRHIHQLALTYLVYPGASHKRFEHSIGVMELAGKVFEVVPTRRTGIPIRITSFQTKKIFPNGRRFSD
jgi:hypothetical protein